MLPNWFYDWYKPRREKYVDIALQLLKADIMKLDRRLSDREYERAAEKAGIMETVHEAVGGEENLKEFNELIDNLESLQEEKIINR